MGSWASRCAKRLNSHEFSYGFTWLICLDIDTLQLAGPSYRAWPSAGAVLAGGGAGDSQGIAGSRFARINTASATAIITAHQSSDIPIRVARTLSSVWESKGSADGEEGFEGMGMGIRG